MSTLHKLVRSSALALTLIAGAGLTQNVYAAELTVTAEVLTTPTVTRVDIYPNGTTVIYYSNGVKSIIPAPAETPSAS